MNTFSKISLLLTASSALFLPACGGGGGGSRDYYVSVQNFRTGSKGFYLSSSPSAEIYANPGGINGRYYDLSEGFKNLVGVGANSSDVAYEDDPRVGDDSGVYTKGSFSCGGDMNNVDLGYYTSGGSSGQGFLYIAFQDATGPGDNVAHFMGASNPTDVKVAGLPTNTDNFWVVQDATQILLVTLNGATIKVILNFATGIADVRLVVASADGAQELAPGGGNMNDSVTSESGQTYNVVGSAGEQVLAMRQTPFFSMDR